MPTPSASATANISPDQEAIFKSLLEAMGGEPTISELADQVRIRRFTPAVAASEGGEV